MNATETHNADGWYVLTVDCPSQEVSQRLAEQLAGISANGDCLLLEGDVGAGKTTLARAFIMQLCPGVTEVTSPTFTLLQTYDLADGLPLWHFDLYRLKDASELQEIGMDDALSNGITLVEWPQIAADYFPASALHIAISQPKGGQGRVIRLAGREALWQERLKHLERIMA